MSEETKEAAKTTEYNLRKAESYINDAERSAKNTGDKKLAEKVSKIRENVVETRKELVTKLYDG